MVSFLADIQTIGQFEDMLISVQWVRKICLGQTPCSFALIQILEFWRLKVAIMYQPTGGIRSASSSPIAKASALAHSSGEHEVASLH
jgi:hypothetical protein